RSGKWAAGIYSSASTSGSKNTSVVVIIEGNRRNVKGNTELQAIYRNRFGPRLKYRRRVWATLCAKSWSQFIPEDSSVLDLGCGYGEFINQIRCHRKWAIDFNPTTRQYLDSSITFLEQDCSMPWSLPDESLDVVF